MHKSIRVQKHTHTHIFAHTQKMQTIIFDIEKLTSSQKKELRATIF